MSVGCHDRDHMADEYTATYAISAYPPMIVFPLKKIQLYKIKIIRDFRKVCVFGQCFSMGTSVFLHNKIDCHDN